jgi:hypothetical protein
MSILMITIAGVMYGHILGLKMNNVTRAKLGAGAMAREAINNLIAEVRGGKIVRLGDGGLGASNFVEVPLGSLQRGTAIQIYPGTNMNFFVRYYLDTNSSKLMRTDSAGAMREIVAEYITNKIVFSSEDWNGSIITNNWNNRVIGLTLQFYQVQYPVTPIGPGCYFDYYQLRTKITRRTLQ